MPRKFMKKNLKKEVRTEVKKQLVRSAEPKNHYSSAVLANIDFNGSGWVLSDPAQGTTAQQRVGDKLRATYIDIRGLVTAASGGAFSTLRVLVFKWKQDTAVAVPALQDVLQNTYLGSALAPLAPLVVGEERSRITILADRTIHPQNNGNYSRGFHIRKKLNFPILFNDNITTGKNQIYMFIVSGDGVTAYPQAEFVSNFTFVDL